MAHQGSKFDDPVEQRGFFVWEDNLEFQLLGIPRPDINIFLRVPAEVSYQLIGQRSIRAYTDKSHDEHERNTDHLKKTVATYDLLCQLFPKDFKAIECTKDGELMSIPQINNLVWQAIKPLLPAERPNPAHSVIVTLGADKPAETAAEPNESGRLTKRFKNASLLLRLQIERQHPVLPSADFLKWSDGDYEFFTPQGLPREVEKQYKQSMRRLAELHAQLRQKLAEHIERGLIGSANAAKHSRGSIDAILMPLTPLAALSSFKLSVEERSVSQLGSKLLDSDLEEVSWAAKQLYAAARQKWPAEFKQPLEPFTGPESLNHIIAKLAEERLPLNSASPEQVKLLEALPRQEFDLLAESIYPYSSLSLGDITEEVASWSYHQKYESFRQAIAHPSSSLSQVRYKLDIISDQITLSHFVNSAPVSGLQVQAATPRYGYDLPPEIEDAGLEDPYLDSFDESLKLFSTIQAAGREDLAAYATLMGHRIRWQVSMDAKNLKLALEAPADPVYKGLAEAIKEQVSEVHPLIWEVLSRPQSNRPIKPAKTTRNRVKPAKRRRSRRSGNK